MIDDQTLHALLLRHAPLRPTALVPALRAFHADDELPLWLALEEACGAQLSAPFFAVAWPGAQALARALSDGVVDVRGRRVCDLGCGSGLAAIAAARQGADVVAVDVDPLALGCARLLAREHGVSVETRIGDATDPNAVDNADVVVAGDVVYNRNTGLAFAACVRAWKSEGRTVVLADSGRPFFDPAGLPERLRFDVDVPRAVEGVSTRIVRLFF
ncbi:MAG: methyltransferase domain-containing protein [Deltaproteobacteria bacterium]|nr:methyltransferase domain-containing protein [Deltaproteobacteria bacterium]